MLQQSGILRRECNQHNKEPFTFDFNVDGISKYIPSFKETYQDNNYPIIIKIAVSYEFAEVKRK